MLLRIIKMKLSIIIPAYNAETTLQKCLDSVLQQSVSNYEVLVINDGSQDRTEELLDVYTRKYPDKLLFQTVETEAREELATSVLSLLAETGLGLSTVMTGLTRICFRNCCTLPRIKTVILLSVMLWLISRMGAPFRRELPDRGFPWHLLALQIINSFKES